jgi:hypothetical protein
MDETAEARWQLVSEVIEMTDTTEPEVPTGAAEIEEPPGAQEAAALIRKAGIVPRQHTGMPADWFTSETLAEWLLGSYLDIVDSASWFAMDPWLSVAHERLARSQPLEP